MLTTVAIITAKNNGHAFEFCCNTRVIWNQCQVKWAGFRNKGLSFWFRWQCCHMPRESTMSPDSGQRALRRVAYQTSRHIAQWKVHIRNHRRTIHLPLNRKQSTQITPTNYDDLNLLYNTEDITEASLLCMKDMFKHSKLTDHGISQS